METNEAESKDPHEVQDLIDKSKTQEETNKNQSSTRFRSYIGFFFAIASAFCLSLTNIFARKAVLFTSTEVVLLSYIIALFAMIVIMKHKKQSLLGPKGSRGLIMARALAIIFTMMCMSSSVKLISPSDSTALFHTNIILVAILSRFIFKEILSFIHIFCVFIAIFGVFLICQPPFLLSLLSSSSSSSSSIGSMSTTNSSLNSTTQQLAVPTLSIRDISGLILALGAAVFVSFGTILLKKLAVRKIDYTFNIIYLSYLGIPVTLFASVLIRLLAIENRPFAPFLQDKSSLVWQCVFVSISATCSNLAQIFLNLALGYEDPAKVSIIRINDLLITFILQSVVLSIFSNFLSILGALFIFIATFLVILYKILYNKYGKIDQDSATCKKCFFYKL